MGAPLNLGSKEADELALRLASRLRKPLDEVVREALDEYDRSFSRRVTKQELWGPLLERAQKAVRESPSDFEIDDLYDPETGLPV